jgi:hypothetical protein
MTEEEKEKARIIASMQKQSGVTTSNLSEETEIGLSATEKAKLFAQGLLFNFSDEAIAGTKSIFGDKTYEEYVNEERKVLNVAREKAPIEALGYEMGGAILAQHYLQHLLLVELQSQQLLEE